MFEKWIDVLSGEDLNLTADEIADICWLALIQHRFGVEQSQKAAASPASLASQLPTTLGSSSTISTDLPDLTKSELPRGSSRTAGGLFAKEASSEPRPDSKPLRVPTAPALRDSLSLAKAMRPLIQQRPIGKGPQLDESATVQKIAEERVWWPVTKPLTENWLELALVVDESVSMLIWRRTIQELNRFFKHYGVFRDVRLWGLIARDVSSDNPISSSKGKRSSDGTVNNPKASSQPEICIRAAPFSHVHSQALRRPDCLLDPAGRRLILIVSDCVDAIWQKPQLLSTLKLWSKNGPMAILQMMPEWLWPRTNLRQTTLVNFQGKAAGSANHALEVVLANAAYYRKSKAEKQADIKVPIITLESDRVHIWTQMLTAQGPHQAPGVIFNPRAREMMVLAQRRRQQVASGSSTATVKAQTFRGAASPIARRLASLLAASPAITLPIVRVVQETLLPQSEQVHVAEVFLGGILQPRVTPAPDTNPDDVEYQFVDSDVRSVLLAEAPVPDTTAVLTQYIEENFKTSLHDFILELRRLMRTDGANQDELKPIATIAAEVLQYRGAEYADFVREVRECYPPSTLGDETDESQSFAVPDLESFELFDARLLDSTEEYIFPPPLEIEQFTIITFQAQLDIELTQKLEAFEFVVSTLQHRQEQQREEKKLTQGKPRLRIAELRNEAKLTQSELAELIGVSGTTIANWETGRSGTPLIHHIAILCTALECSLYELLTKNISELRGKSGITQRGLAKLIGVSENTVAHWEKGSFQRRIELVARLCEALGCSSPGELLFIPPKRRLLRTEWAIQRHQQRAYRFIELLTENPPLEMVLIPGGTFLMGSPDDELERNGERESPQHEVTLEPFFMGRYPVTQAQWRAVAALPQVERSLRPDPSLFKGDTRPVELVSWEDAMEFCDRLTIHRDRQYRLPTEAEWEYACRAGTTTPFHFGETITSELANYIGTTAYANGPKGEYREETTPVDHFGIANAFGLCDMHGNVWEWCQDHWHENYDGAPTDGSAWLSSSKRKSRVYRAGSWGYNPGVCRSAYRDCNEPVSRYYNIGFRVCCSAPRTP